MYWALIPFPTEDVATEDVASLIGSKVTKSNFEWLNWHWKQCALQPSQGKLLYREWCGSPPGLRGRWTCSPTSQSTARFASACPAHITVVVYHEGLLLTQCGVGPPVDREAGDTRQTVFIGELLISFLEILIKSHMTVQTCDTWTFKQQSDWNVLIHTQPIVLSCSFESNH